MVVGVFVYATLGRPIWYWLIVSRIVLLPVIAGIPGVTSPPRLLKFALACGVGPSVEVLRKQTGGLLKLATTREWKPDEVVDTIAASVTADPDSLIRGIHIFPFGGLEPSARWVAQRRGAPVAK